MLAELEECQSKGIAQVPVVPIQAERDGWEHSLRGAFPRVPCHSDMGTRYSPSDFTVRNFWLSLELATSSFPQPSPSVSGLVSKRTCLVLVPTSSHCRGQLYPGPPMGTRSCPGFGGKGQRCKSGKRTGNQGLAADPCGGGGERWMLSPCPSGGAQVGGWGKSWPHPSPQWLPTGLRGWLSGPRLGTGVFLLPLSPALPPDPQVWRVVEGSVPGHSERGLHPQQLRGPRELAGDRGVSIPSPAPRSTGRASIIRISGPWHTPPGTPYLAHSSCGSRTQQGSASQGSW